MSNKAEQPNEQQFVDENDNSSIYDDMNLPLGETDNKRWELDEDPLIVQLVNDLRRNISTPDGIKRPAGVEPIVNDEGISDIISFLRTLLSKNIALSNLTNDEIKAYIVSVQKRFLRLVALKRESWHLSKGYRSTLAGMVEAILYAHFKRAYQEGERKYRKDAYGYSEVYSHDEVHPDEVGRGGFFPFSRGGNKRPPSPPSSDQEEYVVS